MCPETMLLRVLFVAAFLIVLTLQHISGEDYNDQTSALRDGKQHKKNGMNIRKNTVHQTTTEARSEKASSSMSNFKQPSHDSSKIVHIQRDKTTKKKGGGVPSGTVSSGYFLISAWTDVGCTGLVGGILAYALGICIPYPYSAFVTQYQIFTTYSYGTTVVLQKTIYSDVACSTTPLMYANISSNQNGCAVPIAGQPSPFIALSMPGSAIGHDAAYVQLSINATIGQPVPPGSPYIINTEYGNVDDCLANPLMPTYYMAIYRNISCSVYNPNCVPATCQQATRCTTVTTGNPYVQFGPYQTTVTCKSTGCSWLRYSSGLSWMVIIMTSFLLVTTSEIWIGL